MSHTKMIPHHNLLVYKGPSSLFSLLLGHARFSLLAQVHKLRAGTDIVNWVLLALPRPRGRAKSGPLYSVVEQALASATVRKK